MEGPWPMAPLMDNSDQADGDDARSNRSDALI
jgi:hypothetical protein